MRIVRRFTRNGGDAYEAFEFRKLASEISAPAAWSEVATDLLAQKYFRKAGVPAALKPIENPDTPSWLWCRSADTATLAQMPKHQRTQGENDARQVFDRMAGTWTWWGWQGGYFDAESDARAFYDETRHMLCGQMAAPNSPQWFNTGLLWAYGIDGPTRGHFYTDFRSGEIKVNAQSPCSEYIFLDDTACNLASLNLIKFRSQDGDVDAASLEHACRLWTIVLEISVLMAQFPSREIAKLSYDYRTAGLGIANLGGLLVAAGLPKDSNQGRTLAAAISAIMTGTAYATSAEMADELGPFPGYKANREPMLRVIRNHRRAAFGIKGQTQGGYEGLSVPPVPLVANDCPQPGLVEAARKAWDRALQLGERHGFRNAKVSVMAPTGTIGQEMEAFVSP